MYNTFLRECSSFKKWS